MIKQWNYTWKKKASYNKRLYEIRPMILNLLWMYVVDMIDDDYHLVDMGSIERYLNDCVWNSHFD